MISWMPWLAAFNSFSVAKGGLFLIDTVREAVVP